MASSSTVTTLALALALSPSPSHPRPLPLAQVFISCSTLIKEVKLCVGKEMHAQLDSLYDKLTSHEIPAEQAVRLLMEQVTRTLTLTLTLYATLPPPPTPTVA